MSKSKSSKPKLSDEARKTIKVVFLTLFLDLVGFSIIFPLFPEMVQYYLQNDGQNFLLTGILSIMTAITSFGGVTETVSPIVLFGGILGALYSLLQFLFAPFWGSLSDRIGRRPVLLVSITGMVLSYVLWIFSGSFTLLIIARIVGGMMGGNISTATAVVGDVTTQENRSRGMAFVGIAFGTGFIFGPAIGGLSSLIKLDALYPQYVAWGLNPFSMPAVVAMILAIINLLFVFKSFKETLPAEKRGQAGTARSANPIDLFRPLPNRGVNLTNLANFFFLTAFSGMEFTLTFLAMERLGYSSVDNAWIFVYVGVLIALVQGGYVRRKAHEMGERRMALTGMILVIPGLAILAEAYSSMMLFAGLTFLAFGSAMIIPCLTALVSLFADSKTQGKAIGTFRSLGSLARVIGPFMASIIYWRFGPSSAYIFGSLFLIIPMILTARLPAPEPEEA